MILSTPLATGVIGLAIILLVHWIISPLFNGPLAQIPGPKLYALTKWRLALDDWKGTRTRRIDELHKRYGPVVRIGPNEVAFNSLSALRTIYGAGSGFERTSFYSMFDVYTRKNLFTFASVREHSQRKRLLAHAYSKSAITKRSSTMIEEKVLDYLNLIEKDPESAEELFSSLHYFSLDSITDFVYGNFGKTKCLKGANRDLLNDILDLDRQKLSWFVVHLPSFTKWLYSTNGIRVHALDAWYRFKESSNDSKEAQQNTILGNLWQSHESQKDRGLDDMEIASECADHLLAGIDTTSDSLMFMIWAISRPENLKFQRRLQEEIRSMPANLFNADGIASVEICDKLRYLDAVIKETLRLYAPLPASEPRSFPADSTIDGYAIPARTTVSMSPYSIHRNAQVFENPTSFNPDRWLVEEEDVELNRWFWSFSSGARMCIGMHLAMAEMTTLATALYRKYSTSLKPSFQGISPGATSRFEVLSDATYSKVAEHKCYISFKKM
ncbi:unnamed protein product [Penicillium pancosmium]